MEYRYRDTPAKRAGFTLLEMAIALVIIGLLIGGVLTARDLMGGAAARATVAQIEKYQSAVGAFDQKYGALPGDMINKIAVQFGFATRGAYAGEGDGNGVLQGICCGGGSNGYNYSNQVVSGEQAMFWVDLNKAGLTDNGLNTATPTTNGTSCCANPTAMSLYLPPAKIGNGNYVYVWSGGCTSMNGVHVGDSMNYYGVSEIYKIGTGEAFSKPNIPVSVAYSIDNKIDDGLPQSGSVMAAYLDNTNNDPNLQWAGTGGTDCIAGGTTWPRSTTSCFDNNNVSGATAYYSLTVRGGVGANCALTFQFQNRY